MLLIMFDGDLYISIRLGTADTDTLYPAMLSYRT